MRYKTASTCLKNFARYVAKNAKFHGTDKHKLTRQFNETFYCIVPLNDGSKWTQTATPFMNDDGELPDLIREIDETIRNDRIGLTGAGIFFATPDEKGLWHRLLKHTPGIIPNAPATETKPAKLARHVSPQAEWAHEHPTPGHA